MLIYLSLILLATVSYVILQICLITSWRALPITSPLSLDVTPLVSIVVAVRNEAENITACITSIFEQTYPAEKYELIVIDNHSTDQTISICHSLQATFPFTLVDLSTTHSSISTFKKEALTEGILRAKGKFILTTDGDCIVADTWIEAMINKLSSENVLFVTGPVLLQAGTELLQKYQFLEVVSLMVATGGGIQSGLLLISNGANMGFSKDTFMQISGYDDQVQAASGDDVFLLQKIAAINPEGVAFVKSSAAIVKTFCVKGLQSFLSQRKRWASKASHYRHLPTKMAAMIVLLNSMLICISALLALYFNGPYLLIFLAQFVAKIAVDAWMIREGKHFFKVGSRWYQDAFAHFFNPVANLLILAQTLISKEYIWKERITR